MFDVSRRHVQRREQGGGPVPLVVMCHRARPALLEWQARLRPIQGLNLTFLIHREDHGSLRRIDVESHHVAQLRNEVRIGRDFECLHQMRLDAMGAPNSRNGGLVDLRPRGHDASTPVRSAVGRLGVQGRVDDLRLLGERDSLRASRARSIGGQAFGAFGVVPIQPSTDRRSRHAQHRADRVAAVAVGRGQDNLRSFDQPARGGAGASPLFKNRSISTPQRGHTNREWHGHQHITPTTNMHVNSASHH